MQQRWLRRPDDSTEAIVSAAVPAIPPTIVGRPAVSLCQRLTALILCRAAALDYLYFGRYYTSRTRQEVVA
jgi:hypothetical protein